MQFKKAFRKTGKYLALTFVGIIALALLSTLSVKLIIDRAPQYQSEIKDWMFAKTGLHIRFERVTPTLRWYGPELYFQQLELRSNDDQRVLARAKGGRLAFDFWQLLRSGKLLAGRIQLDAPNITIVRLGASSFALAAEIEFNQDATSVVNLNLDDFPAGRLDIRGGHIALGQWNSALPRLLFEDVNIVLRRESSTGFFASATLPPVLGGTLELSGSANGLGDINSLDWTLHSKTSGMAFSGWRKLLPDYLEALDSGSGAFELGLQGHGQQLKKATLRFLALEVVTHLRDGTGAKFQEISGNFLLNRRSDQWSLLGRGVRAVQVQRRDPPVDFDVSWRANKDGLLNVTVRASYLRAQSLLPLAGLLPFPDIKEGLRSIALAGECSDGFLNLWRAHSTDLWHMQLVGKFRAFGFGAIGAMPGLAGLTGTVAGTDAGGQVVLDARNAGIIWPIQFPKVIDLEVLKGVIFWKRTPQQWLVATTNLEASNHDARTLTQFAWQRVDGGAPFLTLVSRVNDGNVASARNYLPHGVIPPQTLAWLDRALVAGHLAHADVLFRGPLRNFPFRDHSGEFVARCAVDSITLDFYPGWPRIEDLTADVEFRNQGLTAYTAHARVGHVSVGEGAARFVDFKNGELQVRGSTSTDAAAVLDFLVATPLDVLAEGAFSSVEASGPLSASVDLFLPLKQFDQRRVLVHSDFRNVHLRYRGAQIIATDLVGSVNLNGVQVATADIRGQLLGGAFQLQSRASTDKPTQTQLMIRGVASGIALSNALGLPAGVGLDGQTDWRAVVKLAADPERERSVHISTNLSGLELNLPQPLYKPIGQALPTSLEIRWLLGGHVEARLALASLLRAVVAMDSGVDGLRLAHAALNFSSTEPRFSDTQIVNISGTIPTLDLTGWQSLARPQSDSTPLSHYLTAAKLQVGQLHYLGLEFRDLDISLGWFDDHWKIGFEGSNQAGTIILPSEKSSEPWNVRFSHLSLFSELGAVMRDNSSTGVSPRDVPAIDLHVKQFNWGDRQLGDIQVNLSKLEDGVRLDQLKVIAPSFDIVAQGGWRGADAGIGRVEGALNSTDVERTLTQLGYANAIAAKSGTLSFKLNWLGPPTAQALIESKGQVQVALDNGQVLGIRPGAGRVLGLASVAALPRRLALDFSDLTDKGMAFDTVRGDFELRGGNAYTENVLLRGPAAEIGLVGRIGLKNRDYDQTAVVTGSVGNSLPLAGVLAGGPVVGAAVLVFTQVFKQTLSGLARGYYHISGGWDSPIVERIKSSGATTAVDSHK